jgi:hypothetical protein
LCREVLPPAIWLGLGGFLIAAARLGRWHLKATIKEKKAWGARSISWLMVVAMFAVGLVVASSASAAGYLILPESVKSRG